ncbi:sensor histidine kinase [Pseudoxanthomonas wuyuanensis]|uniref:Histidine kinase-, DNA gyrase B-, and HSP90-like ATPase n=1 Tax=Pseudoxanthomonas wuyuanensis TaxID=1073196 RepID=A0A286D2S2_9GAMM|nr:sensor histidine kinase [Pseudoxanthomonas wuyuanensis]SOD52955.1 Histidine kinase-, DNA gyrase B-, and HSP90-like ATPase [Pseudoxanthomonas wuyuanensis]
MLTIAMCVPAMAIEPDQGLSSFHHSTWTIREGAPADIWALAQAPDGFLWLGTGSGLFRFDGIRFERREPPAGAQLLSNNITALTIVGAEETWIGYYAGGASVMTPDRIVHYPPGNGMPDGAVYRIARGNDGTIWIATVHGLARFRDGRWHTVGADWNYPWTHADWVLVDSRGTLWVATGDTVVYARPGARAFARTGVSSAPYAVLAEAPDGSVWISDSLHGTRPVASESAKPAYRLVPGLATLQSKRMLFHSDGSLWGTEAERGGVYRVPFPAGATEQSARGGGTGVEAYSKRQGLTSDMAVPVLEDNEGNVWVGTNLGLNRFRRNNVVALAEVAEFAHLGYGLTSGAGDSVALVGGGTLFRTDGRTTQAVMHSLPRITSAHESADGVLWLVGYERLWRLHGGQRRQIALPGNRTAHEIRALGSDRTGVAWLSLDGEGVYRYRNGTWNKVEVLPDALPSVLAAGARGGMWLGYAGSRVASSDARASRSYGEQEGLRVGNVTAISASERNVVVAGEKGIALLDGGRFRSLQQPGSEFTGITGIAETPEGDLWLNGNRGAVRIAATELRRAVTESGYEPLYTLFDAQDGLPGIAVQSHAVSTIIRTDNGLLWFATNQGAAWIDPTRIHRNPRPPMVSIRSLAADGMVQASCAPIRLKERTTRVEIDYTATSLTLAERNRFRYRLEGVEADWQDAGTRRQAFYTNLGPGDYRFRVIAANNDGVWNEQGASLDFSIAPTFFQSRWFVLLCVLVGTGALWLLYLLRLRQLGLHIRTRLHERHMERERIARELHDTLLQSIHGLILRFQAVAETIPPRDPARMAMESALDRADQVLVEGRERVLDLRASTQYSGDMSEVFSKVAEELAEEHPATFRIATKGLAQALDPLVRDEIFRIGREALLNAYHHADAGTIEVEIDYARDELRLRFVDDGRGVDAKVLEGGRPGHWGLSGMRERAARIGGRLSIWSRAGAGTEVELRIPADSAYRPCLKASRWKGLRALFGRRDRD